jgi:hypothetical protein
MKRFYQKGGFRKQSHSAQIVEDRSGQLLDVVHGLTATICAVGSPVETLRRSLRSNGTLELSDSYGSIYYKMPLGAIQVADRFHGA